MPAVTCLIVDLRDAGETGDGAQQNPPLLAQSASVRAGEAAVEAAIAKAIKVLRP